MACITLLTDFGIQDEYVGVMKGVILNIDPGAVVVDVTHAIPAQNVVEASYALKAAFTYFPKGSIHLAIVDPGVGTDREIIAASHDGHILMAPNNGLLWPIIEKSPETVVYGVDNERLYLQPVSRTFHGRDIFAPVAAHLSRGIKLQVLGPELPWNQVQVLPGAACKHTGGKQIEGLVVSVDRFGNLITNIHRSDLALLDNGKTVVRLGDHCIDHWSENYASGAGASPMALIGSRGCLEIAVNGDHAARILGQDRGAVVQVLVS